MSWLYSQALVEEYLGANSLDGERSALLSGNPTQQAYCAPDKMTVFSRLSRFGMTFKLLTENRGEELLTLYREDFRAKTFQSQEKEPELPESAAECGNTWQGLLAKYNPSTSSWKTPQCSLFEDLEQSLETFPRWGSMRNGELYQRQPWEPPISETVFGFSVPTPVSSDGTSGSVIGKNDTFYTTSTGMPRKINQKGTDGSVGLGRLVQMWPTPTAHNAKECGSPSEFIRDSPGLGTVVLKFPTPLASDWKPRGPNSKQQGLAEVVKMWGTPKAQDSRHALRDRGKGNLGEQVSGLHNGGKLNHLWTEWLMGWPIGWTDLKPLEMDKCHCVPQRLGKC